MPQHDESSNLSGDFKSPGGFVFGVSGWTWGEPRPTSITFFLDGTVKVSDQHGRPIKGTSVGGKEVWFAMTAPEAEQDGSVKLRKIRMANGTTKEYATHAQVIAALSEERVDWKTLSWAGWPQLPYAELKKLADANLLPPTPIEELRKILIPALRKDALRIRKETDDARAREAAALEAE